MWVVIDMAKKKFKKKRVRRVFFFSIICLAINFYIIYSVGSIFKQAYQMKKETKELDIQLSALKEEEDVLKSEVNKLKDPVYVAKYAREKFFYSGKDEYIIRIK